jgi:cold shock CspA family protein
MLADQIRRSGTISHRHGELDELIEVIRRFSPVDSLLEIKSLKTEICIGHLKKEGLKPDFGFIRDVNGREIYVRRDSVASNIWLDMCDGRAVQFEIAFTRRGETYAANVDLV